MALIIGLNRYSSNADLRRLCADEHFLRVLRNALQRINEGEREQVEARGKAKLKKWVTKDAKYAIPIGAKGQGKSFPSYETAVAWLLYKTEKSFAANQAKETSLAEEVHGNAKIRKRIFDFLRGPLAAWWVGIGKDKMDKIGGKTGRYSHFYSKLFCNRTIREGFEYFGVGGGGFFSKTVTEANLSISEAAAFIADVALASKELCGIQGKHMGGIDTLRLNLTEVDQQTRFALDDAFDLLSPTNPKGIFAENRHAQFLAKHKQFLDVIGKLPGDRKDSIVKSWFKQVSDYISESVKNDGYLNTIAPANRAVLNSGKTLIQQASGCKTIDAMVDFLRKEEIANYLTTARAGARRVARYQGTLQEQLNADANKTPELYPELDSSLRSIGQKKSRRMEYNVDPGHEWTRFMIAKHAVVGAGPSGTTTFTLGLVELACTKGKYSEDGQRMAAYAVAMALFSFWQRKKKLLKYQSTVHTWNEVCAALDNHRTQNKRSRDALLQVSDTGIMEGDAGCHLYEYPRSFNNYDGRPKYDADGVITAASMCGE